MEHQLLILFGLHPKVLTEALYGLCVKHKVAISKVIGIATAGAKQKLTDMLLNPVSGEFYKLCREYPEYFKRIHFSQESIRVAYENGAEIADIRNSKQSQAYLDLLMAIVSEMTANKNVALHCVVAGGRRTMSVYLAMVLQLLARRQDRLYQLLVEPWEVETNSAFFFPTRDAHPMATYNGSLFDAKDITVDLIEIPYLRLRPRVPNELLDSPNYQNILKWVQRDVEIASPMLPLRIDLDKQSIAIGAIEISLKSIELAIYWYFAEKSSRRPRAVPREAYTKYFEFPLVDGHFSTEASNRIQIIYKKILPKKEMRQRFINALSRDERLSLQHLRPHFTRINEKIRAKLLNEDLHHWYLITSVNQRRNIGYGIRLDREFIHLPKTKL